MNSYENIHFGVDYYPEHWPEKRWETDAKLMADMGVQVVRMAEFSWHKMEPAEGKFDFKWLDKIIELMGKYGIKTVLGTPTAAPPAWLVNKYPEILPIDRNGHVKGFGGRHHDCQSNPVYREKVKEIVTKMAKRYGKNKNVIGWQPDNELGNSHDDLCTCNSCRKSFQVWLKKKYKNIDALNKAWGTPFWSQEYNSFEEIFTPRQTAAGENPSQILDWRCFHSDLIVDFCKTQTDIIRKYSKNQFITHNYMGFSDTVNYYDLGKELDFVSHDQYPSGYWIKDGVSDTAWLGAQLDVVRSYKKKNFWIMEQEAGITGWGLMGRLPKPNQLSMWALQSIAHGADCVVFFRWRTCAFGTEQYWHGVLPHCGEPGRTYNELSGTIHSMLPLMDSIKGSMPKNRVGIVFSFRQEYAFRAQPHNEKLEYTKQLVDYYRALQDKNISVDFLQDSDDFSKYDLLIAPLQYLMNDTLVEKYTEYVSNGGHLVLTMRTGVKDDNNICMTDMPLPGKLSKVTGNVIREYDCLTNGEIFVSMGDKNDYKASLWADLITPLENTEVIAEYASEFYKGTACVTKHAYGKGTCFYVGCEPTRDFMNSLMDIIVKDAKVESGYTAECGVEITSRTNGKEEYIFVINHSEIEKNYNEFGATLIYGTTVGTLAPFEVQIFRK